MTEAMSNQQSEGPNGLAWLLQPVGVETFFARYYEREHLHVARSRPGYYASAFSLEELLRETDTLSVHTPLTPETRGMLGQAQLSLLRKGAVVVNTARGPIVDLDAVLALLRSEHLAGAGIDVLPVEPPVEPVPELLRAYRAKEEWLEGRLVITPHSAWLTPQSWIDTRRKSAETMRAALLTNNPQNVITPDMF